MKIIIMWKLKDKVQLKKEKWKEKVTQNTITHVTLPCLQSHLH